MMKKHTINIALFARVFTYTAVFLVVIIAAAVGLFYQQFSAMLHTHQVQQLRANYQTLLNDLPGLDTPYVIAMAQRFADANQTFNFRLESHDGLVVFDSPQVVRQQLQHHQAIVITGDEFQQPLSIINLGDTFNHEMIRVVSGETLSYINFPLQNRSRIMMGGLDGQNLTFNVGQYTLIAQAPSFGVTAGGVFAQFGWAFALLLSISLIFAYVFARQLERENSKRRQMEQHQAYFFSAASHELKTPIAGARLMMEGMLANIGDYQNHDKYLAQCIQLMDVQSHTIQEILEIVKLDGSYELSPQQVDVTQLVSELSALYIPLLDEKQLSLSTHLKPLQLTTDAGLFKKVLSNVLLNAIQNTQQGQTIAVYSEQVSGATRLCVVNPGQIDADTLPHAFDSFYRGDAARSAQGRTGLGLTIVAKALTLLGYQYGLENTTEGVLFWVSVA